MVNIAYNLSDLHHSPQPMGGGQPFTNDTPAKTLKMLEPWKNINIKNANRAYCPPAYAVLLLLGSESPRLACCENTTIPVCPLGWKASHKGMGECQKEAEGARSATSPLCS